MNVKNNISLFILEDDRIYQAIVENELLSLGFSKIEKFTDGEEMLNNLFKMPDIIVLDYHLEGSMNGVDVLRKIKAFNPDIPVIMLSAQDKLDVAVHSLKYGAFDYVIKNDQASKKLKDILDRIMDWNQQVRNNQRSKRNKSWLVYGAVAALTLATILGYLI